MHIYTIKTLPFHFIVRLPTFDVPCCHAYIIHQEDDWDDEEEKTAKYHSDGADSMDDLDDVPLAQRKLFLPGSVRESVDVHVLLDAGHNCDSCVSMNDSITFM
jgi:hypothetical protein